MTTKDCSLLYRRDGSISPCPAQPQECRGACCGKNTVNCPPRKPREESTQTPPKQPKRTDTSNQGTSTEGSGGTESPIGPSFRGASSLKDPGSLTSCEHPNTDAILCEMERVMKSICNCQNDLPEKLKITSLPPDCKPMQYKREPSGAYTITETDELPEGYNVSQVEEVLPETPPTTPAEALNACTATSCKIAKEICEIETNLKLLRRELSRTRKEQEWLREQKRLLDCVKPKSCQPCPGDKVQICMPPMCPPPQIVACVNTVRPTWTLPKCDAARKS